MRRSTGSSSSREVNPGQAVAAGLETKVRHEAGYVLRQGDITFVLISPLSAQHPDAQRLVTHGDGVMDIAIDVPDVRATFEATIARGATPVRTVPRRRSGGRGLSASGTSGSVVSLTGCRFKRAGSAPARRTLTSKSISRSVKLPAI